MNYKVIVKKCALKFIQKQSLKIQKNIMDSIKALPVGDIKPMQGNNNLYRLRVGEIRIIYTKYDDIFTIYVVNANNRGDIYKRY